MPHDNGLSPDTIAAIQQTGLIIMLLPILLCCILLAFASASLIRAHIAERSARDARKPNRYMQAREQAATAYTARRANHIDASASHHATCSCRACRLGF